LAEGIGKALKIFTRGLKRVNLFSNISEEHKKVKIKIREATHCFKKYRGSFSN
jgi:hypothetical protein